MGTLFIYTCFCSSEHSCLNLFQIAARKQKELHNVNANIKRKIDSVVLEKYGIDDDETD